MLLHSNSKLRVPLKYHLIFWLVYFSFNVMRWGSFFNDYWYSFKSNLVEFPLHVFSSYFTIYYLFPKFILTKKYFLFLFFLLLTIVVVYLGIIGFNWWLVTKNIWPEANGIQEPFTLNHFMAVAVGEVYVIAFVSVIKMTLDWMFEKRKNDRLTKIQLQTELDFLKSQIQPHFYFNTLNSLYALTLEKSDLAPNLVLKLSDIMQYVLYDVRTSKIKLFDEIAYIQNYIDLERIRFGERVAATSYISGDIEEISVPPLLFLPFIENCFKHGTQGNHNIELSIHFKNIDNKTLLFSVVNTFQEEDEPAESKGGIGMKNVQRRLDILYQDRYKLKITQKKSKFKVQLSIPIT